MRAIKLTTAGEVVEISISRKEQLRDLQREVGGYIEIVHARYLPYPLIMIVDEDGRLKDYPENRIASTFYGRQIVGNAVIMKYLETHRGIDIVGLYDADFDTVTLLCGRITAPAQKESRPDADTSEATEENNAVSSIAENKR